MGLREVEARGGSIHLLKARGKDEDQFVITISRGLEFSVASKSSNIQPVDA